ncbi:Epsin-3 [Wickerhamomyces ciferrii]|uniref:Epsin-3 n=1 Tax=Wickerhamomyces ciferrii (strain ATCC 14091 / BCRC 22168 / CBS 111 / JCM 3599 / NBRC 0793 / NRRL Y-1031 F-60-10) TaxID=1206466 RepID=K0KJD5_WICCF|nr:Epsin-3 [Wickerhamomyces ciferrii]CCH42237.1 Epsin-3 [Wickerhamomyces ciferrii]
MSRRFVRSIRNISATPAEIKIKSATSNDSFGPTTSDLNEIALLTMDNKHLRQIITVLTKRLNDSTKNWRHILKSLTVIQYCLLAGSTEFVYWVQNNSYLIKTLKEFQWKDSNEIAYQIRSKAKKITSLLKDDNLLQSKRANYHIYRTKMSQPSSGKRSSLDITRTDDLNVQSLESPIKLTSDAPWSRATKSMEIRRSIDWDGNRNVGRGSDEISRILANIDEE